jgi:dTDP-4-dehydrorhamnose reductase
MTRILVLGSGGMLGHKVLQRLGAEHAVVGTLRGDPGGKPYGGIPLFRDADIIGGVDADDFSTVAGAIGATRPEVVVNCIGVIKQKDRDPIANIAINALFPHRLAAYCAESEIRVIHFSTDCVFNGRRGSYTEGDASVPKTYTAYQVLGEVADSDHVLTLRTSLVGRTEWFHSLLSGSCPRKAG